jgi:hypothetical protein
VGAMEFKELSTGKAGTDVSIVYVVHGPRITPAGGAASFCIPKDLS